MKKIYRAVLLMLGLQSMSMYAAQESLQNVENGRQAMIDDTVTSFRYLTDGFDFLRTQGLVDTSFHDFLEQNISHDEDGNEDMNFDQVIVDAEDVLTKNMKDTFLKTLQTIIKYRYTNISHYPIYLYVMQYKDDRGMRNMLRLWLHTLSKIQDEYGYTALHRAARDNHTEIASMLIDARADVNIQTKDGRTPLYDALEYDHIEIASMLIAAGANCNIQNERGRTLLQDAVLWDDAEKTRILLAGNADVNIKDKNGYSPLSYAVASDNKEIVKMLIAARANPNIQGEDGKTYFIFQCKYKDDEIIKYAGADLNLK